MQRKTLRYFQQACCKALHTGMEAGQRPYASAVTIE
jgi:hypothetical protein